MDQLIGQVTPLIYAVFLATINSELVDFLKTPVERRYSEVDLWWFQYVNLVTGFAIGWFGGANLFLDFMDAVPGRILTGLLIGGGSNLVYRVFKRNT